MPICDCGFDFARARLEGPEFKSYAVIGDDEYKEVIAHEARILAEQDRETKLRRIAEGAPRVGTLHVCPECGALLLIEPQALEGGLREMVLDGIRDDQGRATPGR